MIKNQKQYNHAMSFIDKFTKRIEELESGGNVKKFDPRLYRAEIDGLRAKRAELQEEVNVYDG